MRPIAPSGVSITGNDVLTVGTEPKAQAAMYSIISWLVGFALPIPAGGLAVLYRNSPGSLTWREVAAPPNV